MLWIQIRIRIYDSDPDPTIFLFVFKEYLRVLIKTEDMVNTLNLQGFELKSIW